MNTRYFIFFALAFLSFYFVVKAENVGAESSCHKNLIPAAGVAQSSSSECKDSATSELSPATSTDETTAGDDDEIVDSLSTSSLTPFEDTLEFCEPINEQCPPLKSDQLLFFNPKGIELSMENLFAVVSIKSIKEEKNSAKSEEEKRSLDAERDWLNFDDANESVEKSKIVESEFIDLNDQQSEAMVKLFFYSLFIGACYVPDWPKAVIFEFSKLGKLIDSFNKADLGKLYVKLQEKNFNVSQIMLCKNICEDVARKINYYYKGYIEPSFVNLEICKGLPESGECVSNPTMATAENLGGDLQISLNKYIFRYIVMTVVFVIFGGFMLGLYIYGRFFDNKNHNST